MPPLRSTMNCRPSASSRQITAHSFRATLTDCIKADDTMPDLMAVWKLAEAWDRERPQSVELEGCRAQLYLGAMEIPLIAFRPRPHVQPTDDRMQAWRPVLTSLGLVLDPVEPDRNYKINRGDTNEYVARILPDALKLHSHPILSLGRGMAAPPVTFFFSLPRP